MFFIVALLVLTLFVINPAQAAVMGRSTAVEGQVDLLKNVVLVGASRG
jgi:hypothetical protein